MVAAERRQCRPTRIHVDPLEVARRLRDAVDSLLVHVERLAAIHLVPDELAQMADVATAGRRRRILGLDRRHASSPSFAAPGHGLFLRDETALRFSEISSYPAQHLRVIHQLDCGLQARSVEVLPHEPLGVRPLRTARWQ